MSITFDTPIDLTGIQAPERLADLLDADPLLTPAFLAVLDQYRELVDQLLAAEATETEAEEDGDEENDDVPAVVPAEPAADEEPAQD